MSENRSFTPEEQVPCGLCGIPTTMTSTKRCDRCWNLERSIQAAPGLASRILAAHDESVWRHFAEEAGELGTQSALSEKIDIVVAASDKDESGWLVELPRHSLRLNETPLWWAGGGIKPHMVFDEPVWTLDAIKAVRFCRKEDAIRAIASWEDVRLIKEVKILEHLFLKGNT